MQANACIFFFDLSKSSKYDFCTFHVASMRYCWIIAGKLHYFCLISLLLLCVSFLTPAQKETLCKYADQIGLNIGVVMGTQVVML